MKSPLIDNIVFDVGKVLVEFDWETYLASFGFDRETYDAVASAIFKSPVWEDRDRGLYEDEVYVKGFIANNPRYEKEILQVVDNCRETISLFPHALPMIRRFRDAGYRIYILSNYSQSLYYDTKDRMTFLPLTDGALFSWQVGLMKPEDAIYQELFSRFDLEPSRSLFLDDRLENIEGARRNQMWGVPFTGYESTMNVLKAMGIL